MQIVLFRHELYGIHFRTLLNKTQKRAPFTSVFLINYLNDCQFQKSLNLGNMDVITLDNYLCRNHRTYYPSLIWDPKSIGAKSGVKV